MRSVRFLLLIVMLGSSATAAAHQLKTAVTTVLFNDRTGNIEVMHRFSLHDAEHAVQVLFDKTADMHKSAATQQQFADYVLEHFAIRDLSQQPLELTTVGYQIDGAWFWVYQETPIVADLKGLEFRHNALQEIWRSQQNLLNVEGHGPLQSLAFTAESEWQSVQF
ncbi:DUF6702 family protein [Pseudidiomarina taiwanensis]|uniref:Orphan protein n=1 Tax=Pseudidiomarina taiwanensis TaxID=337250 RepID=A0A432ZER0_9GAMM|nr:DUF6702 family protein [Pseudidiomarina taiwanensis]RUO76423.1 hypothetical protein CWI83_08670 [Pseudidiomarina taiwanensis]